MNNGGNTLCNSEIEYLGQESRGERNCLKQNRIVFLAVDARSERRQGLGGQGSS